MKSGVLGNCSARWKLRFFFGWQRAVTKKEFYHWYRKELRFKHLKMLLKRFVRYANGSFSEAVRPEEPQIALLDRYALEQKFASGDVSIGFVSSISGEDGSAASHTIHSVAFANEYIESGISAEYIYNTKLTAAKEVVQGVLDGISADNDTTKEDVQHTIDIALDQAGITDVTVTVGDLTKSHRCRGKC